MNTINDGGPAFPGFSFTDGRGNQRRNEHSGEWEFYEHGMSLRDWFAGRAMAAGLANGGLPPIKSERDKVLAILGSISYEVADAMIKARDERKEQE